MSAIDDSAKLGVSLRGSTLYSTVFPCHICAKDIITAWISKVMFIEPYPKSKNRELYSNIIEIDSDQHDSNKTPFLTFYGVGPRRYNYFYSLKNRSEKHAADTSSSSPVPLLLKYRTCECYKALEKLVLEGEKGVFEDFFRKFDPRKS